jgi:hypothetical protein
MGKDRRKTLSTGCCLEAQKGTAICRSALVIYLKRQSP